MIMEKTTQMYEGKAKKVFATDDPDFCIVSYKDDATAFNGLKKGTILSRISFAISTGVRCRSNCEPVKSIQLSSIPNASTSGEYRR